MLKRSTVNHNLHDDVIANNNTTDQSVTSNPIFAPPMTHAQHRDLDRGWSWLVLGASFMALFVMGGTNYSAGLIHTTLLDRYGESQSATSWAGALHAALFNLAAPLSGIVVDRYSLRTSVFLGGLLMSVGYLSSAFATSLTLTVFTCGIISGLGGALTWTASMISTGFYFQKYRNLAMGVSVSGTALGIFGLAPAIQAGRETYGTAGLFITLSCIAMQLIVCAVIMRPSSLEIYTKQKKREQASVKGSGEVKQSLIGYFKVLTFQPIVCMSVSMFLFCAGMYTVFQYFPNYCLHEGTLPMQTSFALSVCGVASIFGRLLTGFAASWRNMNEIYVYAANVFLTGLSTTLFPLFAGSYTGQLIFSCLFGLFFGGPFVTITPTNIKFVGVSNMAIALGIELCVGGIGTIVGPVLAGLILDKGGTFGHVFVIAGVSSILGACFGLLTVVFTKFESCHVQFANIEEKSETINGVNETLFMDKGDLIAENGHVTVVT